VEEPWLTLWQNFLAGLRVLHVVSYEPLLQMVCLHSTSGEGVTTLCQFLHLPGSHVMPRFARDTLMKLFLEPPSLQEVDQHKQWIARCCLLVGLLFSLLLVEGLSSLLLLLQFLTPFCSPAPLPYAHCFIHLLEN